jgi:hypothetical protein
MSDQDNINTNLDKIRVAYQQLYQGSETLLNMESTSWIEKILLKLVHNRYRPSLEQIGEATPPQSETISPQSDVILADKVGGDYIVVGGIVGGASGIAIGRGAKAETGQGKDQRDEQYEIAKNWDGQRSMWGFDLSERDLSGLSLVNADLRKTDLSKADLRDAQLKGADLSEADLNGAKYTANTTTIFAEITQRLAPVSS